MQTLSWFIFLGVLLLAILLLKVAFTNKKNFLNKEKNKLRWVYFALLAFLGIWAVPTVNHYIYPKDKEIFGNADYHTLEHKGFVFDSLLYLVRSNYPSNDFPDEALWDNKTGTVILTHDSIIIQNYYEPFFVEDNIDGGRFFNLQNEIINIDISQGFTLTKNGQTLYSLQIIPYKEDGREECYYISQSTNSADTSSFTQPINRGYPLSDIIAHSSNFKFTDELRELFDGAVLVRQNIPIINNVGREKSKENKSALLLLTNSSFFTDNELQINGISVSHYNPDTRFVIPIQKQKLFYSGIGRTKTDIFRNNPQEKNSVSLRYVLPKMQKLRKQDGRLFITSSVDEAVDAKIDGGYLFNIFESENNFNHINARIRYFVGNSRDSLYVETMDLYAENPTIKNIVTADNEFLLQTRGKVNHNVQWIFNLHNLRETNTLQQGHILWFIVIFILLVGLRLMVDTIANTKSLSVLELAVYVVVFCFSIVRLILGWRMSTFVPLEDIDATVFAKMRDGISVYQTTCFSLALPILFQIVSFLKKAPDFLEQFENWCSKISLKCIFIAFVGILVVCYIGSKIDLLNRFLNIPIPIITFLLFNLLLLKKQEDEDFDNFFKKIMPQVLLWILTFAYLFVQDAGFSIIFLLYSLIHFFIIAKLLDKNSKGFKLNEFYKNKYVVTAFLCIVFFFFLKFEGDLLIFIFNYIAWVLLAVSFIVGGLIFYWFKKEFISKWVAIGCGTCLGILLIFSVLDITNVSNFVSDFANSKAHMKFRAEVQKLKSNEAIDDLMLKSDFDSKDITYIMRSAHNQWFINQYNNDTIADAKYFNLQPHFNQGSTFTTQTTDLVITRYVLAEHGEWILFWLMSMLLLLMLIYCYEAKLEDKSNFTILGVFVLLFAIALFVFLSATNRIVFFGQDFPFLSITSRIAVLFPIGLFSMAVWKMIIDGQHSCSENSKIQDNKIWIPIVLIALTVTCVWGIAPQGKNQNEEQFDVSKIISNISDKVEVLDRELVKFQNINETKNWTMDSVWNAYTSPRNEDFAREWQTAISDSTAENKFLNSLLKYFDERQAEKNNPDELLHLRKRNGLYRLCVNKKHYFIKSVMLEDIQWAGEIFAAKTDRYFGFSKISSNEAKQRLETTSDYELDVLPSIIHKQVSNIHILRLDTSWVADKEPLLLITSKQSKGSRQYYHIETDSMTIKGNSSENQLATRIKQNDLVLLNKTDNNGVEKNVLDWKYGQDDEHFLAKNLWLNGRRQLFYPLGKELMWSYNFANLVADTYGNNPEYKDSTIRVSIDYDLHKQFYSIINSENRNKINLKETSINQLIAFKEAGYDKQKSADNRLSFYYNNDEKKKQIEVTGKITTDLKKGIDRVNVKLKKFLRTASPELAIAQAIDEVVEKRFDYSAVVIDGNGRIRALFDYSKNRKIDPNNIKYLNRFLSNLYKESDNSSERDIFGNNALQLLVPGPGSSFKPIAYTAVTSQQQFPWERLDVTWNYLNEAAHQNKSNEVNTNKKFDYYGGVKYDEVQEKPWSIDYNGALAHNNYLIQSNNLYHSVIIMFGMQRSGHLKDILKSAGNDAYAFPVISLDGNRYSFNKDKWYNDGNMEVGQGIMNLGLNDNFNIGEDMVGRNDLYSNYFGQEPYLSILFNQKSDRRGWSYAETGSQNTADRNLPPFIRNGLIQMSLGASPLEVSPLQMATMTMRLATLNRSPNITTLSDDATQVTNYEFFKVPTWDTTAYFNFHKRQVFSQLRQVPKVGTAKGLQQVVNKLEIKGYYIYAKTGTLNKDDEGKDARLKHLLVIISNTPLENVATISELKKVKYYALYLSYIGIDKDEFGSTSRFGKIITATIESELFQKYMNSK
jgi:hypothetical protein